MTTVISVEGMSAHTPTTPWILVLGGITREGNRRARRACRDAIDTGLNVVWFDGFEESFDDGSRVPIVVDHSFSVVVVGYRDTERGHPINAMVTAVPDAIERLFVKIESGAAASRVEFLSRLGTVLRRNIVPLLATIRKKLLRRFSQIFRGIVGWRIIRPALVSLVERAPSPSAVVYGDDFALTQAWRVARVWPEVPIDMELVAR